MPSLDVSELRALANIVDDLDYYQLLELERGADAAQVKAAYYSLARRYHPDAHRALDFAAQSAVDRIAKRISEAYAVLRSPLRRRAYDEHLKSEHGPRLQLAEAEQAGERLVEDRKGRTPSGRRFLALAANNLASGDMAAAARNFQTALTYEPDNGYAREQLEALRRRMQQ